MTASRSLRGRDADARGRWSELLCMIRLVACGWRIVARRQSGARGSGVGELDLVAARGNTLAFIEVKARDEEADALNAVLPAQRARIIRAAEAFISRRPEFASHILRFDVMTVGRWPWPRHHADAWRLS